MNNAASPEILDRVRQLVSSTLHLGARGPALTGSSPLLGAIPELDSMAVVGVLTAIEDDYGILFDDDEVTADVFATLGSLAVFVEAKVRS